MKELINSCKQDTFKSTESYVHSILRFLIIESRNQYVKVICRPFIDVNSQYQFSQCFT